MEGLRLSFTVSKGKRGRRSYLQMVPWTSSDEDDEERCSSYGSAVTEEEEDLANCLILLAHGGDEGVRTVEKNEVRGKRKVAEINDAGWYECKTCDKKFQSFQALGGHRTSHRKPRSEKSVPGGDSDCSISMQLKTNSTVADRNSNNRVNNVDGVTRKLHQCSICGSEFSSGQALGGHMRRHRGVPMPERSQSDVSSSHAGEVEGRSFVLSLDLNLPAPEDQNSAFHIRDTSLVF